MALLYRYMIYYYIDIIGFDLPNFFMETHIGNESVT